jgi:NAD-dependent SIR2 family protein deacetylase
MNCEFCNKPTRLEPINKDLYKIMEIWRCPDCRAQFTLDKKTKLLTHIVFFVDIKNQTFSVELWIPWKEGTKNYTLVRKLPKNASEKISEVFQFPLMRNLTPKNIEQKLKTWILFS